MSALETNIIDILHGDIISINGKNYVIEGLELWEGGKLSPSSKKLATQKCDIKRVERVDGIKPSIDDENEILYAQLDCTPIDSPQDDLLERFSFENITKMWQVFVIIDNKFWRILAEVNT